MEMLEFVLLLLAAVLVSAVLDQVTPRVSLPLVQIALGAVIILLVGAPVDVAIDPEPVSYTHLPIQQRAAAGKPNP